MSMASLKDFTVDELVDYLEANGISEGVVQNFEKIELVALPFFDSRRMI